MIPLSHSLNFFSKGSNNLELSVSFLLNLATPVVSGEIEESGDYLFSSTTCLLELCIIGIPN
jgi:hypothetical protein